MQSDCTDGKSRIRQDNVYPTIGIERKKMEYTAVIIAKR